MTHQLIIDLENAFGPKIWDPIWKNDYKTNPEDISTTYRLFNKHIFNSQIQPMRCVISHEPSMLLAAFCFGVVKRQPVSMIVYRSQYSSFFTMMNVLAHELIHAYDWTRGPLNKMYEFFPYLAYEGNAVSVFNPGHRTYVVYDPSYRTYRDAIAAGAKVYDCHSRWFTAQAQKFNEIGFNVTDIFDPMHAQPRLRRVDEDPDETGIATNPAHAIYDHLKTNDHKAFEYRDEGNWLVEIS